MADQALAFVIIEDDQPNRRIVMAVESGDVAQSVGERLDCTIPADAPRKMGLMGFIMWQSTASGTFVTPDSDNTDGALVQLIRDGVVLHTVGVKTMEFFVGSFGRQSFVERIRFPGQEIEPGDVIRTFMHPVDGNASPAANLTCEAQFFVIDR